MPPPPAERPPFRTSPAFSAGGPLASPFRPPATPEDLEKALARANYLCDQPTALALWLALKLEKPLLLEGPPGAGKTDLARAAADALGRPFLRLQCFEGLDEGRALYDWDYAKQILYTQLLRDAIAAEIQGIGSVAEAADRVGRSESAFYSSRFLVSRPILAALESAIPAVLLIDEVDRADPEFEALLLEVLAEYQVTIPELGTITAKHRPLVILTNNRVREMTDALRRRCLHGFMEYPSPAREISIVKLRVPDAEDELVRQLVVFVHQVRALDLRKVPSIAETVDWARALVTLGARSLEPDLARETLGLLLKYTEDRSKVDRKAREFVDTARHAR